MTSLRDVSPILVLAPIPRCGSTLVQRVLNTHPEVTIWGEQGGALTHALHMMQRYEFQLNVGGDRQRETWLGNGRPDQWMSSMNPATSTLIAGFRDLFLGIYARYAQHTMTWGFKEIRYGREEIEFWHILFPMTKYVMIVRDPVEAILSHRRTPWEQDQNFVAAGWERPSIQQLARDWSDRVTFFKIWAAQDPAHRFLVPYEEINRIQPVRILRLFRELGLDMRPEKVHAVQSLDLGGGRDLKRS